MKVMKGLLLLLLVLLAVAAGCVQPASTQKTAPGDNISYGPDNWRNIEVTDVTTGETFTLSDFSGQYLLIETFAVWCPTCLSQQIEIAKMRQSSDDPALHFSLDVDPSEDENRVREHLERYSFDWVFVVAPREMSQSLVDEFGVTIVNAPSAPMILMCPDGSARLLRTGVKPAGELANEIEKGC